jgi:hypothetical protein
VTDNFVLVPVYFCDHVLRRALSLLLHDLLNTLSQVDILHRAEYDDECGRLVFLRYQVPISVKLPDILSEALCAVRFRHLGQFFMKPSDYYDAPIDKVLHFIRGVGLIKG